MGRYVGESQDDVAAFATADQQVLFQQGYRIATAQWDQFTMHGNSLVAPREKFYDRKEISPAHFEFTYNVFGSQTNFGLNRLWAILCAFFPKRGSHGRTPGGPS